MERGIPLQGLPGQAVRIAEQETLHPTIIPGGHRLVQRSPVAGIGLKWGYFRVIVVFLRSLTHPADGIRQSFLFWNAGGSMLHCLWVIFRKKYAFRLIY